MATITEGVHALEFVLSEANGALSRETITLLSGQNLTAGTVLGKITTGTAAATAFAGNTGNGTMGAITVSGPAKPGDYKLVITEPGTNVGNFTVEDPDGLFVGQGDVAAAFSAGGLAFTLADGATDFVAGDGFTITVTATATKYAQHDPVTPATNGSQFAAAILAQDCDASSADTPTVALVRLAEVDGDLLTWKASITAGQQTAAKQALALNQLVVR